MLGSAQDKNDLSYLDASFSLNYRVGIPQSERAAISIWTSTIPNPRKLPFTTEMLRKGVDDFILLSEEHKKNTIDILTKTCANLMKKIPPLDEDEANLSSASQRQLLAAARRLNQETRGAIQKCLDIASSI